MKKFSFMLLAAFLAVFSYAAVGALKNLPLGEAGDPQPESEYTFDFNAMTDEPCSTNSNTAGDITEPRTFTGENVSLTVSPNASGTANRFWSTANGPQLRIYGGTMTFQAAQGCKITKMVFNNGKWNNGNSADTGSFSSNTWTGEAETVVVTIAGNSQLNNIVVTLTGSAEEEPVAASYTVTPAEGQVETLGVVIVQFSDVLVKKSATFDSYCAVLTDSKGQTEQEFVTVLGDEKRVAINCKNLAVEDTYTLTIPAGMLLNKDDDSEIPEITLHYQIGNGGTVEDEPIPAPASDHTFDFNALTDQPVSTGSSHDGDITKDLTYAAENVTLTISPSNGNTPNRFWKNYSTDQIELRLYGGTLTFKAAEGHLITKIAFNSNGTWDEYNEADNGSIAGTTWKGSAQTVVVTIDGNTQLNYIDVTLDGEPEEELTTVTPPAEAEQLDFTLDGSFSYWDGTQWAPTSEQRAAKVVFDGADVYVQGMSYWLTEGWVKGTLEDGKITFQSPQLYGEDQDGQIFFVVQNNTEEDYAITSQIVFTWDAETQTMTMPEDVLILEGADTEGSAYGFWSTMTLYAGAPEVPEVVEAPADLQTEDYVFTAQDITFDEDNNPNYTDYQLDAVKVGWIDNDVYVQGLCSYLPEAWIKGTKAEDGTVVFEAGQYFGLFYGQYNLFFVGYGAAGIGNVTMTYDPTTGKFASDDWYVLNSKKSTLAYYQIFGDIALTKKTSTAIAGLDSSDQPATYFDLQGRQATKAQKGLLVKQVRQQDGTLKAVKVVRK